MQLRTALDCTWRWVKFSVQILSFKCALLVPYAFMITMLELEESIPLDRE